MSREDSGRQIDRQQLETIFAQYLLRVPVSLALRSTMRMVALSTMIPDRSVVLDVGCGDGCFGLLYPAEAGLVLDGVDLSESELKLARATGAYRSLEVRDVSRVSLGEGYDIVVGNCSMEHVPDIHGAFRNIYQCLRPGGKLLLSVPAFGWARSLTPVRLLQRVSPRVGMAAAGALDGFFQHHHLYGYETWRFILEGNGFEVRRQGGLGSPLINRTFERELPRAFLEFLFKSLFRRYPPAWGRLRGVPVAALLEDILVQPTPVEEEDRAEYVIEAIRPGPPIPTA